MPLKEERLQFLLDKIANFGSSSMYDANVKTLFNYLAKNVSPQNQSFVKYNAADHSEWYGSISTRFLNLPTDYDLLKEISFFAFKKISIADDSIDLARDIAITLFMRPNNIDNLNLFNETFLPYFEEVIEEIMEAENLKEVNEMESSRLNNVPEEIKNNVRLQDVFLIHGHDHALLNEVKLLLLEAGVNPIVLHSIPDRGRSIFEKLVDESASAKYAIALFTPDDVTKDDTPRARQNVLLETGYFIGMLGKANVRMVVRDKTEIPSDLHGILHTQYNNGLEWKINLLRELHDVGIITDPAKMIPR